MIRLSPKTLEYIADASMMAIAVIWGATFIYIKQTIATIPTPTFLLLRFIVATAALALACGPFLRRIDRRVLIDGTVLGIVLSLAFLTQTIGLETTSASAAGFITGLYVVIVPVLSAMVLKKPPHPFSVAGVILTGAGLALITLDDSLRISAGELLVLLGAVFIAIQIILTDRYSRRNNAILLTFVQTWVIMLLFFVLQLWTEPFSVPEFTGDLVFALFLTGVMATAVAFLVQVRMQRYTTPTKAAIIFTFEPVSAAVFGNMVGGEVLLPVQYAGAGLIGAAMVLAEIGTHFRRKTETGGAGEPVTEKSAPSPAGA